jgi:hypothetical protein
MYTNSVTFFFYIFRNNMVYECDIVGKPEGKRPLERPRRR